MSTALRARSFVTPLDVTRTSWLKVFLSLTSSHLHTCAFLFDFTFLPFYFDLTFTVFFHFSFLMHSEQHTELDNLITMQHNLRTSAKGSNDAYDVHTSLTPSELKKFRTPLTARSSALSSSSLRGLFVMSVQDFVSRVTLTDAQREVLPTLEPSFEHLLHDAKVDPATILALRHCQKTDRETFAALDDTVDGLKTVALDMVIYFLGGGMPHKREFARITTAWKKVRSQADIKVTTEALQRQHGEPIAMLPEDWTSVVVQFKKKYGTDLPDEELPAQASYEDFQERLSAGVF